MNRSRFVKPSLCLVGALMLACGGPKHPTGGSPGALSPVTFDPPAGVVAAGTKVTLTAPGIPANGVIFYTTDGSDPTSSSHVAYAGPITIDASQTIDAYATAPGWTASVVANATYRLAPPPLAAPVITHAVTASGAAVAMSGSSPSFSVTAQNAPLTATLTLAAQSPARTYFCASATQATPTCANGSCAVGTEVSDGGTVSIATNGTVLAAVSCAANLQSLTETVTYTLHVTPPSFGAAAATCGDSTSVGFDTSSAALAADLAAGGPTLGGTICYGGVPYSCGAPPPTGVTCFTPSAGAYSQTTAVTTPTLYAVSCPPTGAGLNGAAASSQTGIAAYASAITLGASLSGNWSESSNLFATSDVDVRGGFSHDATTLYFEVDGFAPAASTDVVIFLSDGSLTHALSTAPVALSPAGGTTLPFAAQLAIDYETSGDTVRNLYANDGSTWSVVTSTDSVYGTGVGSPNLYGDLIATGGSNYQVASTNIFQSLVPIAVLPSSTSGAVYVAGEILSGVGDTVSVFAQWPILTGTWSHIDDTLSSCETPVASVQ